MKKTISLVIPCYNEQEVLGELYRRVEAASKRWPLKTRVICIDDGSVDNTWEIISKFAKKNKNWFGIRLSRNFGHQIALSCGLSQVSSDCAVVLDADLQDPPEVISQFISKWMEGYNVVYAVRKHRKEAIPKKIGYWIFYRIFQKLVNFQIPLDTGDFSLIDNQVLKILNSMPEKHRFVRGLRAWTGFKQVGIEYDRPKRFAGETKYPFVKLLKLAINSILSFSSVPLVLASYFGLAISLIAIFGAIFTLLQRIFSDYFTSIGLGPVPGFATTVIAVLFLGGVQLIFLGVIGSYLSRIYEEVKGRPNWIIKETTKT